ncbi:MAG: TonB-dependent receptor [Steroidobacteraceae bacterium]
MLEEVVVTARLRPEPASQVAASTTVVAESDIQAAGLQHFADVMGLVPNLNWSGGTSRPRYYQLRGVGELEQYQGAPNPSVGFLIDDIDFSGVGGPATSFDVQQVEVLRGPQGTSYGANALGGLIKVTTNAPTTDTELAAEAVGGGDGLAGGGVVAGGALPFGDDDAWRLVAQHVHMDGFRHNAYLHRDDTNERDETTLRGRVRVGLPGDVRADATVMYVDLNNGFDAFSLDNSLTTQSNQPGRDEQRSIGASLRMAADVGGMELLSTTSYADSDIVYSFDGDWANPPYWAGFVDYPYEYFSHYARQRGTIAEDLRLTSQGDARSDGVGWVAGLYALGLGEDNHQLDYYGADLLNPPFQSRFDALNLAAYGEAEWRLADRMTLSAGLRVENHAADYRDSNGAKFSPSNTMVGGHLSLTGELGATDTWYATLARGYKAGGFNIGLYVPPDLLEFDPEYLWNLETGVHLRNGARDLEADLAVFYMWRQDEQVAQSYQLDPGDPLSYIFFTDNAASGRNYGLEASVQWLPAREWRFGATLGLLASSYLDYRYGERDLDGREQANAPPWQYSVSAQWGAGEGWMARADVTGSAAFYFDTSHDQKSKPYALVNLKTGYARGAWSVYAWIRNAFDEDYAVRGFYFGLEPPDFQNRLYVQRGDPRLVGITLGWSMR